MAVMLWMDILIDNYKEALGAINALFLVVNYQEAIVEFIKVQKEDSSMAGTRARRW
jgi:hypothetical protein